MNDPDNFDYGVSWAPLSTLYAERVSAAGLTQRTTTTTVAGRVNDLVTVGRCRSGCDHRLATARSRGG